MNAAMSETSPTLDLPSEESTTALARAMAPRLAPGDVVLLQGPVGAGKSHFARAFIRESLPGGAAEDIPSPTYTLVQTYDGIHGEIRHFDLYRLNNPEEISELGLEQAMEETICLVEWPERMGSRAPSNAIRIVFDVTGDESRRVEIHGIVGNDGLRRALRDIRLSDFLVKAGLGGAPRELLAGDASFRRYDRVERPDGTTVVLMDAAPEDGEDVRPFAAVARALADLGLGAPSVIATDPEAGFLLLEDLGDDLFADVVARDPELEETLYAAATDVLVHIGRSDPGIDLTSYDAARMGDAAALSVDWYGGREPTAREEIAEEVARLVEYHAAAARVMTLRDYHAQNLIWLPDRDGLAKVGLLDFQDAQWAHPGYDLVSLIHDARRDVSRRVADLCVDRYLDATGMPADPFRNACAVLSAQRNLRILGVFARLNIRDGKADYLGLLPRVWGHLQTCLADPALGGLAKLVARHLPPPDAERIQMLRRQCDTRSPH